MVVERHRKMAIIMITVADCAIDMGKGSGVASSPKIDAYALHLLDSGNLGSGVVHF